MANTSTVLVNTSILKYNNNDVIYHDGSSYIYNGYATSAGRTTSASYATSAGTANSAAYTEMAYALYAGGGVYLILMVMQLKLLHKMLLIFILIPTQRRL